MQEWDNIGDLLKVLYPLSGIETLLSGRVVDGAWKVLSPLSGIETLKCEKFLYKKLVFYPYLVELKQLIRMVCCIRSPLSYTYLVELKPIWVSLKACSKLLFYPYSVELK